MIVLLSRSKKFIQRYCPILDLLIQVSDLSGLWPRTTKALSTEFVRDWAKSLLVEFLTDYYGLLFRFTFYEGPQRCELFILATSPSATSDIPSLNFYFWEMNNHLCSIEFSNSKHCCLFLKILDLFIWFRQFGKFGQQLWNLKKFKLFQVIRDPDLVVPEKKSECDVRTEG